MRVTANWYESRCGKKDGVLEIKMPKSEAEKQKKRKIKVE